MIMNVIIATLVVAILGLILGLFLGVSSEKFKVEVDELVEKIRKELPGNNCGGCGYAGCDALALAIRNGEAAVNACPVGGSAVGEKIASVMGVEASQTEKYVAFVHCHGTCDKTKKAYNYEGVQDCSAISTVPNKGEKGCTYACIGYGSCVQACKFDAIHLKDGVAVVDKEKCTACKSCIKTCPMGVISLVPYKQNHIVACSSKDKGTIVTKVCSAGCIACRMCEKNCPTQSITITNNLASINYENCTDCGTCAEKCPRKIIL